MAKQREEPELVDVPPQKKLERLDEVVRGVLSVSNKTVQKKMAAEKRKRQAKRKRRS